MARFYLMTSLFAVLLLSLVSGALLQTSTTQAPPPALEGFAGCEFPCFYGIPLDEMYDAYLERLQPALVAAGYQLQSETSDEDSYMHNYVYTAVGRCDLEVWVQWHMEAIGLTLTNCPNLPLGDLLTYAGDPQWVLIDGTELAYGYGAASVRVILETHNWLSHLTFVKEIQMVSDLGAPFFCSYDWMGFLPRWYYFQAQGDTIEADYC